MNRFVVLFAILFPIVSMATDMCARDDTMVMVFDPYINGISGGRVSEEDWKWVTRYSYGYVYGRAACVSKYEYENMRNEIKAASSGVDEHGNERTVCVCRMEYPLRSQWVSPSSFSSATECISVCNGTSRGCGHWMYANNKDYKKRMFGSIGL